MTKRLMLITAIFILAGMFIFFQPFLTGKTVNELNQTNESSKCEPPEIEIAERNLLTLSRLDNKAAENMNENTFLNSFCNRCINLCDQELPPTLKEHLSRFLLREITNSFNDVRNSQRIFDNNGNIAGFNNEETSITFTPSINKFEDLSNEHDFSITKGCLKASFSGSMNILDATVKPKAEINIFEFISLEGNIKLDFKDKNFNEWGCSLNLEFSW